MIDERMYELGAEPSAIRELFSYGLRRKREIGAEAVFDFSIGNPSVPAPEAVHEALRELLALPPQVLHAYTPASGDLSVRERLAASLTERFGMPCGPESLYLTCGAAASLSIAFASISVPGEEIAVVAPYFPEYRVWIERAGCTCVEIPSRPGDFGLDLEAIAAAVNERTAAVVLNSPNNPTGVVYSRAELEGLAEVLAAAAERVGHPVYVVSDEPYRELAYGVEVPWIPSIHPDTVVCYSYSKSLSLPGERIGYIHVPDCAADAERLRLAVAGAGRALGFICAPAMFQRLVATCDGMHAPLEPYLENRDLLAGALRAFGYEVVEPQGAFYLWVRALEDDAKAFSEAAKRHELLLVPSDSFGASGWVRISYCVPQDVIRRSLPAFEALIAEYAARG